MEAAHTQPDSVGPSASTHVEQLAGLSDAHAAPEDMATDAFELSEEERGRKQVQRPCRTDGQTADAPPATTSPGHGVEGREGQHGRAASDSEDRADDGSEGGRDGSADAASVDAEENDDMDEGDTVVPVPGAPYSACSLTSWRLCYHDLPFSWIRGSVACSSSLGPKGIQT